MTQATLTRPAPSAHRGPLHWLLEDRSTGKLVVWQNPNAPLWVWIVAKALHLITDASWLGVVASVALTVWAVLEITRGVNPFRRLLGAAALLSVVLQLVG